MTVFTIGHSTRSADEFVALLRGAGVECVWDIRAFPGSRRYPHFNAAHLEARLLSEGIAYEHHPELGGRRRLAPNAPPSAWRNDAFRAYAEFMHSDEFRGALERLIRASENRVTVIMCSEAVRWRCHRNLVSDALVARGVDVRHIMDGTIKPHVLTSFARIDGGEVRYPPDGGADESGISQGELDLSRGGPRSPV